MRTLTLSLLFMLAGVLLYFVVVWALKKEGPIHVPVLEQSPEMPNSVTEEHHADEARVAPPPRQ
jgi:hypothetical protein